MNACNETPWRYLSSQILCSLVLATFTVSAIAEDIEPEIQSSPTTHHPFAFELDGFEELCGWGGVATHDSVPYPTPAVVEPVSASDSGLGGSVTAAATVAFATVGVSVEQIVEPLAMVGPYLDNSFDAFSNYQGWWDAAIESAHQLRAADTEAKNSQVQDQLDQIATEEPIDIESFGPSVLVDQLPELTPEPGIEITVLSRMVGSSAIIATIEESYLPYDLAAKDLRLWSVLPTSTRPFCIRSHASSLEASPMWDEFDAVVVGSAEAFQQSDPPQEKALAYCGSADCLLDELIWRIESWTADDSVLWVEVDARNIGRRLALIAAGGTRLVEGAAQALASRWPAAEAPNEPSQAGEALLARAGAIAAEAPVAIAEVPVSIRR